LTRPSPSDPKRADALRHRERLLKAAQRLLEHSPRASVAEMAAAAGVSRSTVYRHFGDREGLVRAVRTQPSGVGDEAPSTVLPAGRLGRDRPVVLDAIQVFDVVPPAALPEQLVAEAQRLAGVPVALYVLDIDGTQLLRVAGSRRLPERIRTPLAVGPELDADGVAELRDLLGGSPRTSVYPMWLRGRAVGVLITAGDPRTSLLELARQAAAAVTLSDRYTDVFASARRRKQPTAAAEIQQSLLPPRVSRVTGGEVAGNVLPSYEVAGDWFDVCENGDGVWITVADGLGSSTRAAASSAVALGALRASRRSGGEIRDALLLMHGTLREMPGPHAEMAAVATHWNPPTGRLRVVSCGHVPPLVLRTGGGVEVITSDGLGGAGGLGGRAAPRLTERALVLGEGDRLLLVSDGVLDSGAGQAGLGMELLVQAALRSERETAGDTVRAVHTAVLDASDGRLGDDATVVCLAVN